MTFVCSRTIFSFHYGRLSRTVLSFLIPILFVIPASAQENAVNPDEPDVVETINKPVAILYESDNRRDPFLNIAPPKQQAKNREVDEEIPRETPPPGIAGTFIEKAGFEGIVIRSGDRRIAIIRSSDNRSYLLSVGDRLFDGYIKAIEDNYVVFIRETFMKSGKILTQEVTKLLRKS